jgi:ElaB/YqjD/DUF883 family membrane-anchored ribosome-binding protein
MGSRTGEPAESPRTVDEARDAVERSRQRISSTLDQLEDRIVEKKHELQDKADVLRPIRQRIVEHPFTAVVVGAGVGALLGALAGGSDDNGDDHHDRGSSGRASARNSPMSDEDRAELRRWRRSRRQRLETVTRRGRGGRDHDDDSRFDGLKHQLMGAVTSAITAAVTARLRQFARDNISQLTGGDGRGNDRQDWRGGDYR